MVQKKVVKSRDIVWFRDVKAAEVTTLSFSLGVVRMDRIRNEDDGGMFDVWRERQKLRWVSGVALLPSLCYCSYNSTFTLNAAVLKTAL